MNSNMDLSIENRTLSQVLFKSNNISATSIIDYIKENYELNDDIIEQCKINLNQHFLRAFKSRFQKSMNDQTKFFNNNEDWLNGSFIIPTKRVKIQKNIKPYNELSPITKKRRLDEIIEQFPVEDLLDACQKKLKKSNKLSNTKILYEEEEGSHDFDIGIDDEFLADDEALALFIDAKLTKFQYDVIRKFFKNKKNVCLPEYKKITAAKKRCCPEFDITETGCSAKLQDLLDHTAGRLVKIPEISKSILARKEKDFKFLLKYGCDGTAGFTQYRQALTNSKNLENNSALIYGLVPLKLEVNIKDDYNLSIWQNEHPSSPKYCRVIQFAYEKETSETISSQMKLLNDEIKNLKPTRLNVAGKDIFLHHTLFCTMIDGKTRNVLTETESSQRCAICGVLPKEVNNLEIVGKKK